MELKGDLRNSFLIKWTTNNSKKKVLLRRLRFAGAALKRRIKGNKAGYKSHDCVTFLAMTRIIIRQSLSKPQHATVFYLVQPKYVYYCLTPV